MSVIVKKEGILTTVQDLCRVGSRHLGINPNGVMDTAAVRLINILLGNNESEAVLEMHFPAGEIVFEKAAIFAIGGADFGAALNGQIVENWRSHSAKKGDVLRFTKKVAGNRSYLSVGGGFKLKKWLGSSSTNLMARIGGFNGRRLQKNDRIEFKPRLAAEGSVRKQRLSNSLIPFYSVFPTVRIIRGAEYELLTNPSQKALLHENFAVAGDSNRMGFRLSGVPLDLLESKELISSAVSFGTIQLLPDGQLIVLMADHQTSGGYPRIATVITRDLPLLAQLGPSDKTAFQLVSIEEAEELTLEFERDINWLKTGCNFHGLRY